MPDKNSVTGKAAEAMVAATRPWEHRKDFASIVPRAAVFAAISTISVSIGRKLNTNDFYLADSILKDIASQLIANNQETTT